MLSLRALARAAVGALPLVVLTGVASCGSCGDAPPTPRPLPLDTILGPGEVRCGEVTKASELIGGPAAYGQVGRTWRCHNSEIRFLVQDGSRPVGNSSRGGSLIDVDLVRDSEEEEGLDTFRELVVAYGANEVVVEKVEVVHDGRDGQPAIVRVSGRPDVITLVPQAYFLHQDMPARVETDYILRPDVRYIEVKTRIINESDDHISNVIYADFITFGGVGRLHAPEIGYDAGGELFRAASFLAQSHAPDVSYGYLCSDRDLLIPIAEGGSITAPMCGDDAIVAMEEEYSRYFVVGDGTIESVASVAYDLLGKPTGTAQGTVTGAGGEVVEGVWVSALTGGGPFDDDAHVVNEARTDATGHFELTLQPGTYSIVAHAPGVVRSDVKEIVIEEGAQASRTLALGETATLRVTTSFTGLDGQDLGAMPAKLSVQPIGATQRASGKLADFDKSGLVAYQPSADGRFEVDVPPGEYRVFVTRGFEFTRWQAEVTLAAGERTTLAANVAHVLDTTGWVGAEFHQHSLGSVDSQVPVPIKVLENAAEGVEFASSTDHDNVVDFAPHVQALGLSEHLSVVAGNEVTYTAIGHFNVYPWTIDPQDPLRDVGSRVWWGKTMPGLFASVRELAGDPIVQINHPRSSGAGYFQAMNFNPADGTRFSRGPPTLPTLPETIFEQWSADFEAIEVNGSLGSASQFTEEGWADLAERARTDATTVPVLADWFGFLGAGHHVAAMGNSDSHGLNGAVGYPRNFLYVNEDRPASVREDDARRAIRAQRVSVGHGCHIAMTVDGALRMGVSDAVAPAALSSLRVRVQAPPHVTVPNLELYVNGRVQPLTIDDAGVHVATDGVISAEIPAPPASAPPAGRLDASITGVDATEDRVIVAVARGGGGLGPTGGGSVYCYSAPLYVDAGGDGWVGWLTDTQTVR
jgi:hypothetical protein